MVHEIVRLRINIILTGTSIKRKKIFFQQYFICCPPDSTVSEEAGTEPRTVAKIALAVRRSSLSAKLY